MPNAPRTNPFRHPHAMALTNGRESEDLDSRLRGNDKLRREDDKSRNGNDKMRDGNDKLRGGIDKSNMSHVNCQLSNVKCQSGQMAIVGLIFLLFVAMITGTLFGRTAGFLRFGSNDIRTEQAVNLAEAGADYALWQLNKTGGTYSTTSSGDTITLTNGEFTTVVTNVSSQVKTITSTGYIPNKANPRRKETIKLTGAVNTSQIAFHYAIQTGSGGLDANGNLTVLNGNVWAGCPSPCAVANITGGGSATITGDAYATGTISGVTVTGSSHPNQPLASAPPMPTTYNSTWESDAGTNVCSASGTISSTITIGPCKQTGDLTISGPATTVTVNGTVWVTGNFSLSGNAHLKLSDNYGSNDGILIVDPGTISISGGGTVDANSASPTKGYLLLTTTSAAAGSPAGALNISGGSQSGIFYALNGTANISGGGTLQAIVANNLVTSGGSTINYVEGFGSSQFSAGPGGSWQVQKGSYIYTPSP